MAHGQNERLMGRRRASEKAYGQDRSTFLSNYLSTLREEDPKLLDFFVVEAKKEDRERGWNKLPCNYLWHEPVIWVNWGTE